MFANNVLLDTTSIIHILVLILMNVPNKQTIAKSLEYASIHPEATFALVVLMVMLAMDHMHVRILMNVLVLNNATHYVHVLIKMEDIHVTIVPQDTLMQVL